MRIVLGLSVAPILANEALTEASNSGSENKGAIDQNNSPKTSSTVGDIFHHPNGVGQSSSWGQRMLTPEQLQNITPEQLAERERRKKMADAGVEAGVQGANAVGSILPTSGPEEILPQMIISEAVERTVDVKTTAPKTTSDTKGADAKSPKTQTENPANSEAPTQPYRYIPVPQRDIGAKLNPEYRGNFDDYGSTEKPRFWPVGPQPKPATEAPKKKGSMKIGLVPERKNLETQNIQLKARNLVR